MPARSRQPFSLNLLRVVTGWGASSLILPCGSAHAGDLWELPSLSPESGGIATGSASSRRVAWEASVEGGLATGYVPPFRAEERVRSWGALAGRAELDHLVVLAADFGWIADRQDGAGWRTGPGDVRLGTVLRTGRLGFVDTSLGWEVKLPNAGDEGEIGTDETDARFGGTLGWSEGDWEARASLGLAILGNPLRFANQDDVPLVRAEAAWSPGSWAFAPRLEADLRTARNPGRTRLGGRVRYGGPWFAELGADAGLTPAEADVTLFFRLGRRSVDNTGGGV